MTRPVHVVTGGFGGLASAVARRACGDGAKVVLVGRTAKPPAWVGELGPDALAIGGVDLSAPGEVERALGPVLARLGRIDSLINCVGAFRWQTLLEGDPKTWSSLYAANVLTVQAACRAALPAMIAAGRGAIVNVGASAAVKAGPGMGAYAAAKAGLAKLTESLAEEVKAHGVRVNAVLPSIIDTPDNRAEMPNADFAAWVTPQDLAAVILFLASDAARAVTGALIPVTGRL